MDGSAIVALQRRLAGAFLPPSARMPDERALARHVAIPFLLLATLVVLGAATAPFPGLYGRVMASEQGVVENLTALLAACGAWVALDIVRSRRALPHGWMALWFACFAAGLAFVALEEVSWGQQWFAWQTPHWIGRVNTQGETNFHNLATWSEALPKAALSLAALVAGIAAPLWALWRGPMPLIARTPLVDVWPSAALWPSAAIAFALRIAERIVANQQGADSAAPLFRSLREGLEVFLILFVVAYLVDMRARHRRATAGAAVPPRRAWAISRRSPYRTGPRSFR